MRSPVSASPVVARALLAAPAVALLLTTSAPAAATRPVGYGARGSAVVWAQHRLAALGYLEQKGVDGVFGEETWQAVVAFQGWEQIARDGVSSGKRRSARQSSSVASPHHR
jgi:peptidoglycan hydrolase-like protein with peptidoglycan-binding domain